MISSSVEKGCLVRCRAVYVALQHGLKYMELTTAFKRFLLLCSNLERAF